MKGVLWSGVASTTVPTREILRKNAVLAGRQYGLPDGNLFVVADIVERKLRFAASLYGSGASAVSASKAPTPLSLSPSSRT